MVRVGFSLSFHRHLREISSQTPKNGDNNCDNYIVVGCCCKFSIFFLAAQYPSMTSVNLDLRLRRENKKAPDNQTWFDGILHL